MTDAIRDATLDDVDFIAELELSLFPEYHVNEYMLGKVIKAGMIQVFDHVGYISTAWGPELIDILRVGVNPTHQGRGIGRALMEKVISQAWLPLVLTVKIDNTRAQNLYKKLGFKLAGIVPQEQALVMLKR